MKKHLSIAIAGILALSAPSIAKAQFTITATTGGVPTVSGATLENFDELSPSILTLSGPAYLLTGSDGVATPPYFSGSTAAFFGESPVTGYDSSKYVAVEPGGSATFSFSTPQLYFGLLWGTIDPYAGMNDLTFYDSANNVIGTVYGENVLSQNGSPSPGDSAYVNITSTTAFSRVVATATPIYPECFEFDDIAYAMVIPEPASLSLLLFGLFGITLLCRHQR
jgi:hypothetical protein